MSVSLLPFRFKIKHEGPEEWDNMWQKSRAIWKYIDRHYKNDFDWFVLGGDDIFLIVENLRKVDSYSSRSVQSLCTPYKYTEYTTPLQSFHTGRQNFSCVCSRLVYRCI